ncbi:MAG: thiamine pyrophosphate-dependent enzyme, partial [Phycisphaerales bacterium]|nr:thiamine pyrophosphate-dependent enzyme [Phycisphaerales bacterium]
MSILTAKRADMCYCPGCSHGMVLEQLGKALDGIGVPPSRVCIVSDIGCIGTADRYFSCHTFHGLHGRSITYAEGIKRRNPELLVVVLIGDGGCGIGTAHLVHAARRRADIKVLVCNNFNFGMTGGQHSPTTPMDAHTTTTPGGAADQPLDVCRTVAVNGAAYSARHDAFDPHMVTKLRDALSTPGFVLLDIWELCTAYFVPANRLNRSSLDALSVQLGMPFGVVHEEPSQPKTASHNGARPLRRWASETPAKEMVARIPWPGRREICVAGSAGQHVRSAVGIIGEIAVAGGLYAAQQDDFPITVRRGFSISNLIVSNEPIHYTGLDSPDTVVILSMDGLARFGPLSRLKPSSLVVAPADMPPADAASSVLTLDLKMLERRAGKESVALAFLTYALIKAGLISAASLNTAAKALPAGPYHQSNLDAI